MRNGSAPHTRQGQKERKGDLASFWLSWMATVPTDLRSRAEPRAKEAAVSAELLAPGAGSLCCLGDSSQWPRGGCSYQQSCPKAPHQQAGQQKEAQRGLFSRAKGCPPTHTLPKPALTFAGMCHQCLGFEAGHFSVFLVASVVHLTQFWLVRRNKTFLRKILQKQKDTTEHFLKMG